MQDKDDFEFRVRESGRDKGIQYKVYRIYCDKCNSKLGYASIAKARKLCKTCQYELLSELFSKEKETKKCPICGKDSRLLAPSQKARSEKIYCSRKCADLGKRKPIEEVNRSTLKSKLLQELDRKKECVLCGHSHIWNLEAHHKIPVVHGGPNTSENLEFLCQNCHGDTHHKGPRRCRN